MDLAASGGGALSAGTKNWPGASGGGSELRGGIIERAELLARGEERSK
jgi:hypothetical protein